ncbi:MAG TPA: FAD-binding domain [Xanthobacteraceae bacterium]|nr:FAD-binding domain [Xanthobacteraceae bacterium]
MNTKTVLISGAGIGGPALAFWLHAAGFEPTLVERAPRLRTGGYVIDFWGLGYEIAERMGLAAAIRGTGYRMRELRIVDGRGRRAAGFGIDVFNELTGGRFVTLRRSDLSRLLFDKIERHTEVIFGDEIDAIRERADGVEVGFQKGGIRRFDLVIGADGLHSRVRELTFGPEDAFEERLGYLVAAFETQGYRPRDENIYVLFNAPGRMLGRIALADDRTLFLLVVALEDPLAPLPADLPAQKALLQRRFAGRGEANWECESILADLARARELYFDRVSQIKMDKWSKGRVALIGDAAFCVSLMAGQGSALAMISAYVLAGELAAAAGRYEAAFANYENRLRGFIEPKRRGAKRFATAFAPRTAWGLFVRNRIIKTLAIPGAAKLAVGREIIDDLRLPDYPWPMHAVAH